MAPLHITATVHLRSTTSAGSSNRGPRAPTLLAGVFLALGKHSEATEMADLALHRDRSHGRARKVKAALTDGEV